MACKNFTLFYFILAYQDVLESQGEILGCERNAGQCPTSIDTQFNCVKRRIPGPGSAGIVRGRLARYLW
ncbi:Uncharacterized protein HZ326_7749 [Fusarium oxysporum f. sp. albedinis]|nr:Uncharacterized protein HZ326_7749 [Fusarium oxysporum f. sp. albedinis]